MEDYIETSYVNFRIQSFQIFVSIFILHNITSPSEPRPLNHRFFTIILRYTSLDRTPLGWRSAQSRDQ